MRCFINDLPSIKDFGAIGDGVVDDTAAIQSAVDSGYSFVPSGTYKICTSIKIPKDSGLVGFHAASCRILAQGIQGPVIDTVVNDNRQMVKNISIEGVADIGLRINESRQVRLENIELGPGDFYDGFVFNDTWASSFRDLSTNAAIIQNYCFYAGRDFNANHCSNWYTSNFSQKNIVIDGGHGSNFGMMTCQGGVIGLDILRGTNHTFSGFYSENVVLPISIGDQSGPMVTALCFSGGSVGGPYSTHPAFGQRGANIHINYARGVAISGMALNGYFNESGDTPTLDGIYYGDCSNISVAAIYTPSLPTGDHSKVIKRMLGFSSGNSHIGLSTTGNGHQSQLMMRPPVFDGSFYLIEVASDGSIVSIPHTSDIAVSPSVGLYDLHKHEDTQAYTLGQFVYVGLEMAGENVYRCVTAGTSGTGTAPTGTGDGQSDGTVTWDHHGTLL